MKWNLKLAWCGLVLLLSGVAAWAQTTFLDPQKAFLFSARMVEARTIEARFEARPGYYLYHEAFRFGANNGVVLGIADLPRGQIKFDEAFQKNMETHRGVVLVRIPVSSGQGRFTLTAHMQGCADAGLCYPPETRSVTLNLTKAMPVSWDRPGQPEQILRSDSLWAVFGAFITIGLLLSFTPCVLPMLPILSSLILGQTNPHQGGEGVHHAYGLSRTRGFLLALSYCTGMILVYTALGIAAGLAGEGLGAALQQPWLLSLFALLLVLFALAMFGVYTLQLPNSWQERLTRWSNRQPGGRFLSVFIMGALSALMLGPCMAAPLAGVLVYLSQTRDVLTAGSALFAMSVGMSVPLLLLGASAGSLLPRAGDWMNTVRYLIGVMLLMLALWMLNSVWPTWLLMLSWGVLLMVCGVYLRVFDRLTEQASGWHRLGKGLGVVLVLLGSLQLVGVASGSRNLLQPLDQLSVSTSPAARPSEDNRPLNWNKVSSVQELERILASAPGKIVMLDFWAQWCVSCVQMERLTFSDPLVMEKMHNMLLLKVDVTHNTEQDKALLRRFSLFGPPGIIFFDAQGQEVPGSKVIGFMKADKFLQHLSLVQG
ncbi:MAG: protein-disulfide reductase DsbD [Burkholderiales bacterium]|jgi:thiol:disulfide interchange protein DsbD